MNKSLMHTLKLFIITSVLGGNLLLVSCASLQPAPEPVRAGEKVEVDYTCRLGKGAVLATTDEKTAEAAVEANPLYYFSHPEYGTLIMQAGKEPCLTCDENLRYFLLVLEENIAFRLPGLPLGKTSQISVTSNESLMNEKEGTILMRRKTTRSRIKPVDSVLLEELVGRAPEIGETIDLGEGKPFKVLSIDGPMTTVEYLVEPDMPLETSFGPAVITDVGEKDFSILITPEVGHVVRSGPLLGKVISIDKNYFTLDYRNPFGYEELTCDVTVDEYQETVEEKHASASSGR